MKLKFLGSDNEALMEDFIVGNVYEAAGTIFKGFVFGCVDVKDEHGEMWIVNVSDPSWEVIE